MNDLEQAKELLGELFITGIPGTELSDDTAAFLSQARIGGIILFSKNYESPQQVAEFIHSIQECRTELPLWISVDQEGGQVQRFKTGFTKLPTGKALAQTDSPALAFEVAQVAAKELKAVGVNLNFSPVTDINTNPKNPVIGDRAFGDQDEMVSKIASAVVRGHLTAGVQACSKHFPGHGDTELDSHFDLPIVNTPLETLRGREFRPFVKVAKSRCSFLMTAHILNPEIDPEWPATLSKITLQDILRKELRYNQIIISDDLEMEAITKNYGATEVPRLALQAGCDLLIYRTEEAARKAYTSLLADLDEGRLSPQRVLESAERSRKLKNQVLLPYEKPNLQEITEIVGCKANQELVDQVSNT
jgi:beta-N-acetylhexosaminidase